eukprot:13957237-Alexandrium_andersonii.AAC.1
MQLLVVGAPHEARCLLKRGSSSDTLLCSGGVIDALRVRAWEKAMSRLAARGLPTASPRLDEWRRPRLGV